MKIGLLSDTHGYCDNRILGHLADCDEIWHAGDIGSQDVAEDLELTGKLRAVYGNIDGGDLRFMFKEEEVFTVEGLRVYMVHIGGYPPKYTAKLKERLDMFQPGLFVCGHSHILKVIPDHNRNLLHMNPGAAGMEGFHKVRTMMTFEIANGKVEKLNVIELGKRERI